ncbi:hypothetical protein Hypma_012554, partial [Hypsizygus marmoreus]
LSSLRRRRSVLLGSSPQYVHCVMFTAPPSTVFASSLYNSHRALVRSNSIVAPTAASRGRRGNLLPSSRM